MNQSENMKSCDCKGRRTCLLCEKLTDKKPRDFFLEFQVILQKAHEDDENFQ